MSFRGRGGGGSRGWLSFRNIKIQKEYIFIFDKFVKNISGGRGSFNRGGGG